MIIILILVPSLLFVYFDARQEFHRAQSEVVRDTQRFSEFVAGDVEQLLESSRILFASVALAYRAWPQSNAEEFPTLLSQIVLANPLLAGLKIADSTGRILVSAGATESLTAADRELVQATIGRKELGIGKFELDFFDTHDVLHLGYYVRNEGDKDSLLVLGALDFGWLEALFAEERLSGRSALFPEGMVVSVLAQDGTVLSRYPQPKRWMGRVLRDAPILQAMLAEGEGAAELPGIDGILRLYSFCPVRGSSREIYVSAGIDRDTAFADATHGLIQSVTLIVVMGGILLLLAWYGTDALVLRPIQALARAVNELGNRKFSARVTPIEGPYEIRKLAESFNEMSLALKAYDDERNRHQVRLLKYEEQLRSLSMELSLTEERERHRIALGLHDNIGQMLASCYVRLSKLLKSENVRGAVDDLSRIQELLNNVIDQVQSLTFELSSPILYTLGLPEALSRLCEDFDKESSSTFVFNFQGDTDIINTSLRALLFRTARELLFNVVKHAEARHITLSMNIVMGNILMEVVDDGVGFDTEDAGATFSRTGGFGLFTIRERVTALDGCMTIDSVIGKGTHVKVEIPIRNSEGDDNDPFTAC